jgi:hypothetical protein
MKGRIHKCEFSPAGDGDENGLRVECTTAEIPASTQEVVFCLEARQLSVRAKPVADLSVSPDPNLPGARIETRTLP